MSAFMLVAGLALLAAPGALGPIGARLAPSEWCRVAVACLRGGRLAVVAALALAATPAVLRALGAHELAHMCHRTAAGWAPMPDIVGWVALGALALLAQRMIARRRRDAVARRRLHAEPWLGLHRVDDSVDVVTLPCATGLAYALPGAAGGPRRGRRSDQIVVSDGLVAALDRDEMAAVLRHERAHLRHRHDRALGVAAALGATLGWLGPVRRSLAEVRLAVERWADEEAGTTSPAARPAVRRALLKTVGLAAGPVPAFTDPATIVARLTALAEPPPHPGIRTRLAAVVPPLGLLGLVVAFVALCELVAHHAHGGAMGFCPF